MRRRDILWLVLIVLAASAWKVPDRPRGLTICGVPPGASYAEVERIVGPPPARYCVGCGFAGTMSFPQGVGRGWYGSAGKPDVGMLSGPSLEFPGGTLHADGQLSQADVAKVLGPPDEVTDWKAMRYAHPGFELLVSNDPVGSFEFRWPTCKSGTSPAAP